MQSQNLAAKYFLLTIVQLYAAVSVTRQRGQQAESAGALATTRDFQPRQLTTNKRQLRRSWWQAWLCRVYVYCFVELHSSVHFVIITICCHLNKTIVQYHATQTKGNQGHVKVGKGIGQFAQTPQNRAPNVWRVWWTKWTECGANRDSSQRFVRKEICEWTKFQPKNNLMEREWHQSCLEEREA